MTFRVNDIVYVTSRDAYGVTSRDACGVIVGIGISEFGEVLLNVKLAIGTYDSAKGVQEYKEAMIHPDNLQGY